MSEQQPPRTSVPVVDGPAVVNQAPAPPPRGVSPIFLLLVALLIGAGAALAMNVGAPYAVFAFVVAGWVVSLCLHEFGHAAVAWLSGDRSVAERGYLTLNPLAYANPLMSIGFPLLILATGGIGFPGGAVYVNTAAIRNPFARMAVSAAGPAMNFLCLCVLAAILLVARPTDGFAAGLAFLAFLQATALVLNLLPVPGLDGFGMLQAFLPAGARAALAPLSRIVVTLFLAAMIFAPQFLDPVWDAAVQLSRWFGIAPFDIGTGYNLFRFWAPVEGQGL